MCGFIDMILLILFGTTYKIKLLVPCFYSWLPTHVGPIHLSNKAMASKNQGRNTISLLVG